MQALRIAYETREEKQLRHQRNRQEKEFRQAKLARTRHGEAHDDVELANIYRELGIDYLTTPTDQLITLVHKLWEGRRIDKTTDRGLQYLRENYDATAVRDNEGRLVVSFFLNQPSQGEHQMKLYNELAERSGQPRKAAKAVYEALIKLVHSGLKHERRIRLPELGIIKITFRAAKEKRKGISPFTKKEMWFKAKPAMNKIRFSPIKVFKQYVEDKIPVEEPKKKKKHKDHDKKKHKKHRHHHH